MQGSGQLRNPGFDICGSAPWVSLSVFCCRGHFFRRLRGAQPLSGSVAGNGFMPCLRGAAGAVNALASDQAIGMDEQLWAALGPDLCNVKFLHCMRMLGSGRADLHFDQHTTTHPPNAGLTRQEIPWPNRLITMRRSVQCAYAMLCVGHDTNQAHNPSSSEDFAVFRSLSGRWFDSPKLKQSIRYYLTSTIEPWQRKTLSFSSLVLQDLEKRHLSSV